MTKATTVALTPRPWKAYHTSDGRWIVDQPGQNGLRVVYCGPDANPYSEGNARLIAAAPDYHEEAKGRIARHDSQVQAHGGTECQDEFCNTFRPIVAKAEGRS